MARDRSSVPRTPWSPRRAAIDPTFATDEGLLGKLSKVEGETETMVIVRLDRISERRKEIQGALSELEKSIDDVRREAVNETEIRGLGWPFAGGRPIRRS